MPENVRGSRQLEVGSLFIHDVWNFGLPVPR